MTRIISYIFFISVEVLATLTTDVGRIMSKLHLVQPNGNISLLTGIRIAHVIFLSIKMSKK
jgi:26S proteasome regulatory subunit N10